MSSTTTEPTDHEKEILATYEGHDADIPSNEGYVLDEQGEKEARERLEKRRQSLGSKHSKRSRRREENTNGTKNSAGDVEKAAEATGIEDTIVTRDEFEDPNIVWWDGPDDPENPLNWAKWKKIMNVTLVSSISFVTPLASCKSSPCKFWRAPH
jgi:hypothetical protein